MRQTTLREELLRYHKINDYVRLMEQAANNLDVPEGSIGTNPNDPLAANTNLGVPPANQTGIDQFGGLAPTQTSTAETENQTATGITGNPEIIDVEDDPDVEKLDTKGKSEESGDSDTEELDITDLVDSQKNIEQKQSEYFDNLFNQLSNLENKLGEMDKIMGRLDVLDKKIEKYRERTPQEKLELRTYDSYPFNQKLSDFFVDKQGEMKASGKNEYVLTPDDVSDINTIDIKNSFYPGLDDELSARNR